MFGASSRAFVMLLRGRSRSNILWLLRIAKNQQVANQTSSETSRKLPKVQRKLRTLCTNNQAMTILAWERKQPIQVGVTTFSLI